MFGALGFKILGRRDSLRLQDEVADDGLCCEALTPRDGLCTVRSIFGGALAETQFPAHLPPRISHNGRSPSHLGVLLGMSAGDTSLLCWAHTCPCRTEESVSKMHTYSQGLRRLPHLSDFTPSFSTPTVRPSKSGLGVS